MLCAYKHLLSQKRIILASTSERRRELLNSLGLTFEAQASPFDEDKNRPDLSPVDFTNWTALQKAKAVVDEQMSLNPADIIIGADTIVSFENEILGKPKDENHAKLMLKKLQGNFHEVITAVSIFYNTKDGYKEKSITELTKVKMAVLSSRVIDSYVETGEPLDKAGSYGIQGLGGTLIEQIEGDYFNVVGFPLHRFTVEMLSILQETEGDLSS